MIDQYWIVVPNWDKFQHYKDRVPPWIKLHLEILDKPELDALTHAQMGVLIRVWALYARCRGTLSVQKVVLSCGDANTQRHLKRLNHAGLIELRASKPLAQRREEKKREERERASTKKTEPRSNAGAYRPFSDYIEQALEQMPYAEKH
jgi:hypothetical protein